VRVRSLAPAILVFIIARLRLAKEKLESVAAKALTLTLSQRKREQVALLTLPK